jgi:hypothetical protein
MTIWIPTWLRDALLPVGVGLSVLLIAYFKIRDHLEDRDPSAGGAPDSERQLVGVACAHCQQLLQTAPEGVFCKACAQPLHRACRKEHRRAAHREPPAGVYR